MSDFVFIPNLADDKKSSKVKRGLFLLFVPAVDFKSLGIIFA